VYLSTLRRRERFAGRVRDAEARSATPWIEFIEVEVVMDPEPDAPRLALVSTHGAGPPLVDHPLCLHLRTTRAIRNRC